MRRKGPTASFTAEEIKQIQAPGKDRTDWAALDRMSEEELERRIAADPDAENGPIDRATVEVHPPRPKTHLTERLDADMVDWFKAQGKGYQTRMNAVLRACYEQRRRDEGRCEPWGRPTDSPGRRGADPWPRAPTARGVASGSRSVLRRARPIQRFPVDSSISINVEQDSRSILSI